MELRDDEVEIKLNTTVTPRTAAGSRTSTIIGIIRNHDQRLPPDDYTNEVCQTKALTIWLET